MWQISRPPCGWCEFEQVFNGQLGHLYKLGDWKTAASWPMLKLQSYRVTDTQGYPVYGWVKFFVPDFNKLPYSLGSQRNNSCNETNPFFKTGLFFSIGTNITFLWMVGVDSRQISPKDGLMLQILDLISLALLAHWER